MIATPPQCPRPYSLGPAIFWLAFLHLLLIAGVIHRARQGQATYGEVAVMGWGLLALWPIIVAETWIAVLIRDRVVRPLRPTVIRAIWITFLPPVRMGMPCPFTGQQWLPWWGWCERGKGLEDRLDRVFHKPMLIFAILILPILALEFARADDVRSSPSLGLAVHLGVAIIWVAFATEFVIKVSAARRPFVYAKTRWVDLAIIILPLLEFALTSLAEAAPLARLLRLTRAAAPEQIARMGQVYRLRGVLVKGWRLSWCCESCPRSSGIRRKSNSDGWRDRSRTLRCRLPKCAPRPTNCAGRSVPQKQSRSLWSEQRARCSSNNPG